MKAEAARTAGGEIVAWGPANGLARFRCKGLWTHVQRAHQDADGAAAKEGPLARPCPSDDRRQKPV